MEIFKRDDYMLLLDDMARAGMNSLLVVVKWMTTGYRSRLPFLDQLPDNPIIASDNALLRQVIEEAGKRKIKVWLGAVVTYFEVEKFGMPPNRFVEEVSGHRLPLRSGIYDLDTPGLAERVVRLCEDLVELFPGMSGLMVELEHGDKEQSHRISLYNAWAKEHGRPSFEELRHPLNPRNFDVPAWRDYATHRRLDLLAAVEGAVRARDFSGDLAMICEHGKAPYAIAQAVNLEEYHRRLPEWRAVTYEYDKWDHRYAVMDFCIARPKEQGLQVYYLPRGVMTYARGGGHWPLPISLEESWRRDIEDIQMFRPHGVWWFGCGTLNEGGHVSLKKLQQSGYRDGVEARRALLKATATSTG